MLSTFIIQPTKNVSEMNQYISQKCTNTGFHKMIDEVNKVVDSFCETIKTLLKPAVVDLTNLTTKMMQFHNRMTQTLRTFDRYMELRGCDSYVLRLLATKINTTIQPYKVQLAKQVVEKQESFQTLESFCGILNKYETVVISQTHEDIQLFQMLLLQATKQELNSVANKIKPINGIADKIIFILGNLKTFCSTCKIDAYVFGGLRGILYQQLTNDKYYIYAIVQDLVDHIYMAIIDDNMKDHEKKIQQIILLCLSLQLPIYAYIHDLQNMLYALISKFLNATSRPRLFRLLHNIRIIRDMLSIYSYSFSKICAEAIQNYFSDSGSRPDQLAVVELVQHYQLANRDDDLDSIQLFDLIGEQDQCFLVGTIIFNYLAYKSKDIQQNTRHCIELIKMYYILDVAEFLTNIINTYERTGTLSIDKEDLNYSGLELGQVITSKELLLGCCELKINNIKVKMQPFYAQMMIDRNNLSSDEFLEKYDNVSIRQLEISLDKWDQKTNIITIVPIYEHRAKQKRSNKEQGIHTIVCQLSKTLKHKQHLTKEEMLQISQNEESIKAAVHQLIEAGIAEIQESGDIAYV